MGLDLSELGWNDLFQDEIDHLGLEGVIVGRVYRVNRTEYGVLTKEKNISARISGKLRSFSEPRDLPAVGDWVLMKELGTGHNIFMVLDRMSCISRKVPGKEVSEQVVASNVDIVFIVMGLDNDYNVRRLERYLAMVVGSGCRPVIILNKSDLIEDDDPRIMEMEEYSLGADIHFISAKKGVGIENISSYLGKGVTAVLVGSSGAGKSTIINALSGEQKQATGEVRGSDSRGRHVTTHRELFLLPRGGMLIDNPGIREIQLWGGPGEIEMAFPDIVELSKRCRFKDCAHEAEPKCAVKKAVDDGFLAESRYDNFLKMKRELAHLEAKMDQGVQSAERIRWKGLMKDMKHYQTYKKAGR